MVVIRVVWLRNLMGEEMRQRASMDHLKGDAASSPSRVHQRAQQVAQTICGQAAVSDLGAPAMLKSNAESLKIIENQTGHRDG